MVPGLSSLRHRAQADWTVLPVEDAELLVTLEWNVK
jgi:hypothetical protein